MSDDHQILKMNFGNNEHTIISIIIKKAELSMFSVLNKLILAN